jgi:calcineurin-like phosphoesterase family protein
MSGRYYSVGDDQEKEGNAMLFFTSDLHMGHANVIRFANRPYRDVDEMNDAFIANINRTVGTNDDLYILGDLSYRLGREEAAALIRQIRCRRLHLIKGNHDKNWEGSELFVEVCDYKEVKIETGLKLVLFHYPIMDWSGRGHGRNNAWSLHLHGHIHSQGDRYNLDNFIEGLYRFDVGVDANEYRPVELSEITSLM